MDCLACDVAKEEFFVKVKLLQVLGKPQKVSSGGKMLQLGRFKNRLIGVVEDKDKERG